MGKGEDTTLDTTPWYPFPVIRIISLTATSRCNAMMAYGEAMFLDVLVRKKSDPMLTLLDITLISVLSHHPPLLRHSPLNSPFE